MSNFKKASKLALRFETSKGMLSVEQLWNLGLAELDEIAVALDEKAKPRKSFISDSTDEDKEKKLKFEIVKEILDDKLAAHNKAQKAAETREHNQKIMAMIERAENAELEKMSPDELKNLLK